MLIRDATPERDAGACAAIYAPYVRDTVISLEEHPPTADEFARRIEQTSATHPWIVAQDENEVIGYAYATRHRERASYRWAADVAVYINSEHHRRGVGRALYKTLFPLLIAQGLRIACAGVTLPNEASVGLHESLGFRPVGVYRNIGFKHGTWRDVGWWQLDLGASDGDEHDNPPHEPPPDPGPPVRLNGRNPG
jgi:L-amino acid N-acyltransferase YncA